MPIKESAGQAFWRLERGDTLSGVAKNAFQLSDQGAIQKKVQELLALNPHIKNANHVEAGRVLALGPARRGTMDPVHLADLLALEDELRAQSRENTQLLDYWDVMHGLAVLDEEREAGGMTPTELASGMGAGAVATKSAFEVEAKFGFKILKAINNTAKEGVKGTFGNRHFSPHLFRQVEGQVVRHLGGRLRYVQRTDGALGLVPKGSRAFNIGGKAIIVNPDAGGGMYAYSRSVKLARKVGDKLLKPAGKIFKVIDFGVYVKNMHDLSGTEGANRAMFAETSRYGFGLAASATAVPVAGAVCGVLTVTTTPVGGAVCYLSVFILYPMAMQAVGEELGGAAFDAGQTQFQKLYESPFAIPFGAY